MHAKLVLFKSYEEMSEAAEAVSNASVQSAELFEIRDLLNIMYISIFKTVLIALA